MALTFKVFRMLVSRFPPAQIGWMMPECWPWVHVCELRCGFRGAVYMSYPIGNGENHGYHRPWKTSAAHQGGWHVLCGRVLHGDGARLTRAELKAAGNICQRSQASSPSFLVSVILPQCNWTLVRCSLMKSGKNINWHCDIFLQLFW